MLEASADYARNRGARSWPAPLRRHFSYYQRLDRVDAVSHSAGLGASVRLPKQATLQVNQTRRVFALLLVSVVSNRSSASAWSSRFRRTRTTESLTPSRTPTLRRMALAFGSARGTRVTASAEYDHTDFQRQTVSLADRPTSRLTRPARKSSRAVSRNGASVRRVPNTAPASSGSAG